MRRTCGAHHRPPRRPRPVPCRLPRSRRSRARPRVHSRRRSRHTRPPPSPRRRRRSRRRRPRARARRRSAERFVRGGRSGDFSRRSVVVGKGLRARNDARDVRILPPLGGRWAIRTLLLALEPSRFLLFALVLAVLFLLTLPE